MEQLSRMFRDVKDVQNALLAITVNKKSATLKLRMIRFEVVRSCRSRYIARKTSVWPTIAVPMIINVLHVRIDLSSIFTFPVALLQLLKGIPEYTPLLIIWQIYLRRC